MTTKTERIRALNDVLRTTGIGGRILITRGIAALPPADGEAIMRAVKTFNEFSPENDPHGEHDCAVLTAVGQRIIFKIDYYDRDMTYLSPDPSDPGANLPGPNDHAVQRILNRPPNGSLPRVGALGHADRRPARRSA